MHVKPIAGIIAALALSLGLFGCSGSQQSSESADAGAAPSSDAEASASTDNQIGDWYIATQTDDFGDEIAGGDKLIQQRFVGDFSNTATSSSDLAGILAFQVDIKKGRFGLLALSEYGNHPATYTDNDSITLKTKNSAGATNTYTLTGTPPNGILVFDANNLLSDIAAESTEVRCIVEIGSSKYNFSIARSNFDEVSSEYDAYLGEKADAHEIEVGSHSFAEAFDKLSSDNSNEACANARAYIRDHVSELKVLNQEDVEKLFPGTYAMYGVQTSSNGRGDVYTYDNGERTHKLGIFDYPETRVIEAGSPGSVENYVIEGGLIKFDNVLAQVFQVAEVADGYYVFLVGEGEIYGMKQGEAVYAVYSSDEKGNPLETLDE